MVSYVLLLSLLPLSYGYLLRQPDKGSAPLGDMVFTPLQKRQMKLRGAYTWAKLWPNGVVPYVFDNALNSQARSAIQEAINFYNRNTCIRIIPKRSRDKDYVRIYDGGYGICNAYVGVNGGEQLMSIGSGCEYASVTLHEFGHVLGFMHEQQRPDRDSYVTINYSNVIKDMQQWFAPYSSSESNLQNIKYDYYSIMHYPKWAFSSNGGDTIITKDGTAQEVIGNQKTLSKCDLEKINKLYKCTAYIKNDRTCIKN